jgi:hypothetical protein
MDAPKTPGQLVRENLSLFPCRQPCAVIDGVVAMTLDRDGVLFWHLRSNLYQVHFPRKGQRLDLNELRELSGVYWVLEEKFVAECVSANNMCGTA